MVVTGEAVSINKLRLTSLIKVLHRILYQSSYCDNYVWINVVRVQISVLNGTYHYRSEIQVPGVTYRVTVTIDSYWRSMQIIGML